MSYSHKVEPVEAYEFRGKLYRTKEAAEDAAEEMVANEIKQPLLDKGFTITEWVKVCEVIITHRQRLALLLDY